MRNGADCPAIDAYRQDLHDEAVATGPPDRRGGGAARRGPRAARTKASRRTEGEAPDVQQECPATFGNSDIYGGSWADPTTP